MPAKKFTLPKRSLNHACTLGEIPLVKQLIESGSCSENEKEICLHAACTYGKEEVVRYLIEKGINVNGRDAGQHTPLMCAAFNGHQRICRLLLEHGANPSLFDNNLQTAEDQAANKQHNRIMADLRFSYLGPSQRVTTEPTEAITSASLYDLKLLRNMEDWNPSKQDFIVAVTSYIQRLMDSSPEQHESLSIIKWLLLLDKSLVNAVSSETTETALIMAAGCGDRVLVELLMKSGADITAFATDHSGTRKEITARERARISKNSEIESLLSLSEAETQYTKHMAAKSSVDPDDRSEWIERLRSIKSELNRRKTEHENLTTATTTTDV